MGVMVKTLLLTLAIWIRFDGAIGDCRSNDLFRCNNGACIVSGKSWNDYRVILITPKLASLKKRMPLQENRLKDNLIGYLHKTWKPKL